MKLGDAEKIACRCVDALAPFCERIQIAGSIRRKAESVKDIEIVAIPKSVRDGDLFQDNVIRDPGFCDVVNEWKRIKGSASGKYTQRELPEGIKLDLFTATEKNWGLILAIRTGPSYFSHLVLAKRWVKLGFHSVKGMLTFKGDAVAVSEEEDLFEMLRLEWIKPEERGVS